MPRTTPQIPVPGTQVIYHDPNSGGAFPATVLRSYFGTCEYDYTVDVAVHWGGHYEILTGLVFRWAYPQLGNISPPNIPTYTPVTPPLIEENYVDYTVIMNGDGSLFWSATAIRPLNLDCVANPDALPSLPDERYLVGATLRIPCILPLAMNTCRYIVSSNDAWRPFLCNCLPGNVADEGQLPEPPSMAGFTEGQTMDIPCIEEGGGGAA